MRIVVACDWFLKYASEQAASLAAYGHDVVLLRRSPLGEFDGSVEECESCLKIARDAGVTVRTISGGNRSARGAYDAVRNRAWLHAWNPDLVHVHPNSDPWLFTLFGRRWSRIPLILTIHDPSPHPGTPALGAARAWIDQAFHNRADGFVVHGEELRRLVRPNTGQRPVWVVPHGIRVDDKPLPIPATACLLLFGRLLPYKGLGVLMEAMQMIWEVRPDVRLVVAGTGPSEEEVAVHQNIETHFRYISEQELPSFFERASLVVAPYIEASQSGVVSLALGRGIPVVVSDAGALPDLALSSESVARAGDSRSLASAILQLLGHSADTRRQVLEMARSRFSWAATAEAVTPFYEAFASNRTDSTLI